MQQKILFIMLLCFILLTAGCTVLKSGSLNEQDNRVDDNNGKTILNELTDHYQIAEDERMHFRNDMENILRILNSEGKIPFYKECDSEYLEEHARVIESCFNEKYVNVILSDEKTSKEIKPIIVLLMVEGISPPDFAKEGEVYYKLTFYQSVASKYEVEDKNAIRSPFDGINTHIIGLENKEGKWNAVYFGNGS
ncbi:MAG: hypothetical protein GX213_07395 [Clostridiaceae bacterium]|nr:hypothetical protein [Clostridiaceae bacterium]